MWVGYARVSTSDQRLDLQRDALLQSGCTKIFEEIARGATAERTCGSRILISRDANIHAGIL